ncbi:hypothetical protein QFC20_004173 [Naganishia adeliensis]|uniref:Uncharacterized protein n=1 Tax=Naganishia adeliensis TaxID=92952 RepID=A0ACC2W3N9_9TREE|nr:hypothetical protein QFC20_004173 [Naganishia adeliensis]
MIGEVLNHLLATPSADQTREVVGPHRESGCLDHPDRNYDRGRSRSHSRPPRDNGSRTPNQSYGPNPISPGRRIADSYVPHPPYPNSRADDRDVNRSGTKSSVPALLKRIDTDSNDGARGKVGTAGPGIGGMNRQSNGPSHLQQRPGSATSPPRTSSSLSEAGTAKKRPHADIDNSEKRGRAPPILASSAQDAQTSSGSATPAGFASRRDPPRTPSHNDSVSDPKPTQKRSKSVGRSSSMGKGTTSGGEEERARANAKAGGSHSSKARGKSTAYQARVDPAVLQLVKASYALYNAEATVDKFRLETAELEKSLGQPVKDMSPEDQQAIRELVNEFGLQRDAAKNERDKVIIGFQSQALPIFRGMVEDILRKIRKSIEHAPSETRVSDAHLTSNGVDEDTKNETHQQEAVPAPLPPAQEVLPPPPPPEDLPMAQPSAAHPAEPPAAAAEVDEPMPDQTKPADAPAENAVVPSPVPPSEAENREAGAVEQPAQISDEPTAMEVDDDKELKVEVPVPVTDAVIPGLPNVESAATASALNPETGQAAVISEVPLHPDEILPENKGERRKLVELARKFGKLEEQVLYQEEQLNEYLDSRSLEIEAKSRQGEKRPTTKVTVPGSETGQTPAPGALPTPVPIEPVSVVTQPSIHPNIPTQPSIPPAVVMQSPIPQSVVAQPAIPPSVVDMATIEAIRADAMRSLDEQLQQLAQEQERRLAAMAQAQEDRVNALGVEIRIEIQSEAARAEQAYAGAIEAADDKAGKLEAQSTALQTELTQFKQERKIIEDIIKQQSAADQLIKTMRETIRESTLKTQIREQAFRNNNNTRLGEIDDRLTAHNDRLTEYTTLLTKHDERLVEHTEHLMTDLDSKLLTMSPFEETKEAWRSDMIDMKNHVVGRVDYLEEQVESIKKPLVARLNAQTGEHALASPIQRTSSPVAQTSQPTWTPAAQALGTPSHRPIVPQQAQAVPLPPPASQPVQPQPERAALTSQAVRASPADTSNRLTPNRGAGTPGAALNSTASLGHPGTQPQPQSLQTQHRLGFAGHANGAFEQQFGNGNNSPFAAAAPPMHNPLLSQSWRGPSNSPVATQQSVVQPRLSTFGDEPDQAMRIELVGKSSRSTGIEWTSRARGIPPPADSALSARLNGGQYQRSEASPQPLLPLRMRMHNGAGVAIENWGQPGSPSTQSGMANPGSGQVSPATSEGALGGRLGARMFDPGEAKPPLS